VAKHYTAFDSIVNCPDGIALEEFPGAAAGGFTVRGAVGQDGLLGLFSNAGFDASEALELTPPPGGAPVVAEPVEMEVRVDGYTQAVVLVEREGVLSWRYPERDTDGLPLRSAGRFRFRLDAAPSAVAPESTTRHLLHDAIANWLGNAVRIYVLRFAARAAVAPAARYIERDVSEGWVTVASLNPAEWRNDEVSARTTPVRRILLLVHGTFSNTAGSFGALGSTPAGRAILQCLIDRYDLVVGFDHRTLTDDPRVNAQRLLDALGALKLADDAEFDAIAFSRGGLVLRLLTEQLLPGRALAEGRALLVPRRLVFVGCTNGGTSLARPENWKRMLDLYTNLVLAGTRAAGWIPGLGTGAAIAGEMVKSISAFVQAIAESAIGESRVPGIAAMRPDSDVVQMLNEAPINRSMPANGSYCWVGASFDARQSAAAAGFAHGLRNYLLEDLADQLFREPNDLVVDCAMMANFGKHSTLVTGNHSLSLAQGIYHTIYFTSAELIECLGAWLLDRPGLFSSVNFDMQLVDAEATASTVLESLPPDPRTPVVVKQRWGNQMFFYLMRTDEIRARFKPGGAADANLADAIDLRRSEAVRVDADESVIRQGEDEWKVANAHLARAHRGAGSVRTVALMNGKVVGVVPDDNWRNDLETTRVELGPVAGAKRGGISEGAAGDSVVPAPFVPVILVDPGGLGRAPVQDDGGAATAGGLLAADAGSGLPLVGPDSLFGQTDPFPAMPAAGAPEPMELAMPLAPEAPKEPVSAPAASARFECMFEAQMPSRPSLSEVATVKVSLSRELHAFEPGPTHQGLTASVQEVEPIVLTARAIHNCQIVGATQVSVSPPTPGEPRTAKFAVAGLAEGEAELWIIAVQAQRRLVTIPLNPGFIGAPAMIAVHTSASLNDDQGALIDLRIRDTSASDQSAVRLEYDLVSDDLQLLLQEQSVQLKDQLRLAFIQGIYKQIEKFWRDAAMASKTQPDKLEQFMEDFHRDLRKTGGSLCDQLVPVSIRRALWQAFNEKRVGAIRVLTREPSIPWEMLYLRDPDGETTGNGCFLAELGLLRWNAALGYPPARVKIDCDSAFYLIPDYPAPFTLQSTATDRALLEKLFKAKRLEATKRRMYDLFEAEPFDLFHAGCHGEAVPGRPWESGLLLLDASPGGTPEYLRPFFLEGGLKCPNRPLVFLNACQVGKPEEGMTGAAGLGQAFLDSRKASILVAPMWSVHDHTASLFAQSFYEKLVGGSTLVSAVRHARQVAKAAGDPTWLAYSVWGHPFARIELLGDEGVGAEPMKARAADPV
jgi:hypothetical protein